MPPRQKQRVAHTRREKVRLLTKITKAIEERQNASRNTLPFPPEVLANIFAHVRSPDSSHDVVRMTHVCREWRQVALSHPFLWSAPDFAKPALANMMLDRVKEAPFNVVWDRTSQEDSAALVKAFSKIHLARRIEVASTYPHHTLEKIFSKWDSPPRHLVWLQVCLRIPKANPFRPEIVIGQECPALRGLELIWCRVPWHKLPVGRNLTYLHLENGLDDPITAPSLLLFLSSLQQVPLLETLRLHRALPNAQGSPLPTPIAITSLRRLQLHDRLDKIEQFVAVVHTPGLNFATISLSTPDNFCINRLLSTSARLHSSSDFALNSAHNLASTGQSRLVHLTLPPPVLEGNTGIHTGSSTLSFGNASSTASNAVLVMKTEGLSIANLAVMHEKLDLSGLISLSVVQTDGAPYSSFDTEAIRRSLHQSLDWTTDLRVLNIHGVHKGVVKSILDALNRDDGSGNSGSATSPQETPRVLFPNLRGLTLSNIILDLGKIQRSEMISSLIRVLRCRPQITVLKVERCTSFSPVDYERIRQDVPAVQAEWDALHVFKRPDQ